MVLVPDAVDELQKDVILMIMGVKSEELKKGIERRLNEGQVSEWLCYHPMLPYKMYCCLARFANYAYAHLVGQFSSRNNKSTCAQ